MMRWAELRVSALNAVRNHVLDSIAATTTDPNHFDLGALVEFFGFDHFDGHVGAPITNGYAKMEW